MNVKRNLIPILAIGILGGASVASANDNPVCDGTLDTVEAAINTAVFIDTTNTRKRGADGETNRSNLLVKLDDARVKVDMHKYSDAIDKLTDISDAATLWADADKPKLEDASDINYAVSDAIICIGGMATAQ